MNTFLLLFFVIAEVALAYVAISKQVSKGEWKTVRFICNGGELLLFIVMLLLPGIDAGMRFRFLIFVLIIRILISGIDWLINKKNGESKRTSAIVTSVLVSIILLAVSMAPSYIFADYSGLPTTGEYAVETAKAILVDESREETFEQDGSKREVPIYFFYPADQNNESFPVVFFSHGAFGYYQSNYSTYAELVSHGYVVISMEHPYHSMFTRDTEGKMITVDSDMFNNTMLIQNTGEDGISEEEVLAITKEWIELRLDDAEFVVDTIKKSADEGVISDTWNTDGENKAKIEQILPMIDTEHIGFMGHSLGGATAVSLGRVRDDIDAVIDLDGTMIGEVLDVKDGNDIVSEEPYPVPILSIDNDEHHNERLLAKSEGRVYPNNVVHDNAKVGYNTYVKGSGHMNFTDLPMFAPMLANMLGTGDVDAKACMQTVNEIVLSFYDSYLKGEGEFTIQEGY